MVPWLTLLAAAKPKPGWETPVLITTAILSGALLLAALVIAVVKQWQKRNQQRNGNSASGDQLSHFRSLYERGDMSREEFERVRALLGKRLRKELAVPAPPPPAAQAPPDGQAPPPEPPAPPEAGPPPASPG